MIWDRVAPLYDLAVNTLNRRVYDGTGTAVARLIRPGDTVLECACGTGAISAAIAPACARVVATDFSEGMLKQARKKLARFPHVVVEQADITDLHYADDSFDAVVALISRFGVHFQEHFDPASYRAFFERMGYTGVTYRVVRGRIPCMIAIIQCH